MKEINQALRNNIHELLLSMYGHSPEIIITPCRNSLHGDLTTNIAFLLAAMLKQSPQQIALELAKHISHEMIIKVEAVAGYLNFSINNTIKLQLLQLVLKNGFLSNIPAVKKRYLFEFVSSNPTGLAPGVICESFSAVGNISATCSKP